jgi:general secretion pathway protein A
MYLQFYGLRETPFSPTPDPKFLFQSTRHREALAQLLYGVRERKGFIVLTGEIGTRQDDAATHTAGALDHDTHVAYIHNSALEIEGLLEYMLQDWGLKSTATTHAQRLFELNEFLIDQHRQG